MSTFLASTSIALPDTTHGRNALVSVQHRDIRGCSFGFTIVKDRLINRKGRPALRQLLDVNLFEVTIATAWPAYLQTTTRHGYPGR